MTDSDSLQVRSAPLGGSALSLAIQHRGVPPGWDVLAPAGVAAWRAHVSRVREANDGVPHEAPNGASHGAPHGASHGAWLDALHGAFGTNTHSVARARLAEAARHGVVVTTGQQPGLFGGPAYTITKALSALALADELSAQLRIPVAPVFWAATDDADWHEATVTHVVGPGGLERLQLVGPATDGVAMADVPLGDVSRLRAALRAACGSLADPMVLDVVDAAYTDGATIGSAYVTWLRTMLEPLGISVLDASHPSVRAASHSVLCHALQYASAIDAALRARNDEITSAGFSPQVEQVDGLSLVFETIDGVRARVPLANAAARAALASIGSFGANVLLRPVLERALMPTAAYVAGPGELAYFAQSTAVAQAATFDVPIAVPRWSAQWREPSVTRLLERLGVSAEELQSPHVVEARLARAAMDRNVADAIERLRVTLDAQIGALGNAVSADASLVAQPVVDGLSRDVAQRVTRVERRLIAAVKRRERDTARDIAVLRAALYPLGSSPERVLSLVPTLARYGMSALTAMRELATVHARAIVAGSTSSSE